MFANYHRNHTRHQKSKDQKDKLPDYFIDLLHWVANNSLSLLFLLYVYFIAFIISREIHFFLKYIFFNDVGEYLWISYKLLNLGYISQGGLEISRFE